MAWIISGTEISISVEGGILFFSGSSTTHEPILPADLSLMTLKNLIDMPMSWTAVSNQEYFNDYLMNRLWRGDLPSARNISCYSKYEEGPSVMFLMDAENWRHFSNAVDTFLISHRSSYYSIGSSFSGFCDDQLPMRPGRPHVTEFLTGAECLIENEAPKFRFHFA